MATDKGRLKAPQPPGHAPDGCHEPENGRWSAVGRNDNPLSPQALVCGLHEWNAYSLGKRLETHGDDIPAEAVHAQLRAYDDAMPLGKSRWWKAHGELLAATDPDGGSHPLGRDEWELLLLRAVNRYPHDTWTLGSSTFMEVVASRFDLLDDGTIELFLDQMMPTAVVGTGTARRPSVVEWLVGWATDETQSDTQRLKALGALHDEDVPCVELAGGSSRKVAEAAVRVAQRRDDDEADAARVVFGLVHGKDHVAEVSWRALCTKDIEYERSSFSGSRFVRTDKLSVKRSADGRSMAWGIGNGWFVERVDAAADDGDVVAEARRRLEERCSPGGAGTLGGHRTLREAAAAAAGTLTGGLSG